MERGGSCNHHYVHIAVVYHIFFVPLEFGNMVTGGKIPGFSFIPVVDGD